MPQNRFDPGQQFRVAVEGGAAHPDLDEGLLDQVAGPLGIAQPAHRFPEEQRVIAAIEQTQRSFDGHASFAARAHKGEPVQGLPEMPFVMVCPERTPHVALCKPPRSGSLSR